MNPPALVWVLPRRESVRSQDFPARSDSNERRKLRPTKKNGKDNRRPEASRHGQPMQIPLLPERVPRKIQAAIQLRTEESFLLTR